MRHSNPNPNSAKGITAAFFVITSVLVACAGDEGPAQGNDGFVKPGDGKYDSSVEGVILNFEFDGELLTDYAWDAEGQIQTQLLYTIGHLNADKSVGRLDRMVLEDVQEKAENGRTRITYHAILPVAWGKKNAIPKEYTLTVPKDVSASGLEKFTEAHKKSCVDYSAHDVDSGSMWYYFRPRTSGCAFDASEVTASVATVSVSTVNTTGKYPEYHKVWEDKSLRVVTIFGKYEDGATEASDAGIANFNNFVRGVREHFATSTITTTPSDVPAIPGIANPDVTFDIAIEGGRTVQIVALLVDNVREAGPAFDARYADLSERADIIIYNGHAGLGSNVRAMARKGRWVKGQYVIVFQNGCDTYAYIDNALDDAHAAVNDDDPVGSKYIDTIVNAMPSYFNQGRRGSLALIDGLLSVDEPKTFEQIFTGVDPAQVILVTGEHDNVFVPGYGEETEPTPEVWAGLSEGGTLAKGADLRYATPVLAAGNYTFTITGTGDADLYVRIGREPSEGVWDCRPYRNGSEERCEVELGSPAPVHVLVHGWAAAEFSLTGSLTKP